MDVVKLIGQKISPEMAELAEEVLALTIKSNRANWDTLNRAKKAEEEETEE